MFTYRVFPRSCGLFCPFVPLGLRSTGSRLDTCWGIVSLGFSGLLFQADAWNSACRPAGATPDAWLTDGLQDHAPACVGLCPPALGVSLASQDRGEEVHGPDVHGF